MVDVMVSTFPLWFRDGYAARVGAELDVLARHGWEVRSVQVLHARYMCSRGFWRWAYRDWLRAGGRHAIAVQLPDKGIPRARRWSDALVVAQLDFIMRRARPNVVHAQGVRAGALLALITRRGWRLVLDVHGDVVAELETRRRHGDPTVTGTRREWAETEQRLALEGADEIVVVSPAMRRWLAAANVPIHVIPAVGRTAATSPARLAHSGGSSRPFRIVYSGNFQPYQPADLVARAARSVRDCIQEIPVELWVFSPSADEDARRAFEAEGLSPVFRSLPPEELVDALRDADVGIVPRLPDQTNWVSSPTKVSEYLAAGLGVLVSSAVGFMADELRADRVGESLDAEPGVLREFLLGARSARNELRDRALQCAREKWSWDAHAPTLLELYSGGRRLSSSVRGGST